MKAPNIISIIDEQIDEKVTKAIETLNQNLTAFTLDEYEEFKKQLLNEPEASSHLQNRI